MLAGIDRYVKENNYHVSIIRYRVFAKSRAVIQGKFKNLREHRKGKRANKSNSLSENNIMWEVNIMWERGQLGAHSQTSLINTIWWLFTLHWALLTLCRTLLQKCKIRTLKMNLFNYVTSTCFTCCHNHGHNMFCDVNVFDVIRSFTNKK